MVELANPAPEVVQNSEAYYAGAQGVDAALQEAYASPQPLPDTSNYAARESIIEPMATGESSDNSLLTFESPFQTEVDEVSPAANNFGPVTKLDESKSPIDLVKDGTFAQGELGGNIEQPQALEDGNAPRIIVQPATPNSDVNQPKSPPNFVVHQDGTIEMFVDPEGPPPLANIRVQVEQGNSLDNSLPEVQQKSVDILVDYLAQRITEKYADALPKVSSPDGEVLAVDIRDKRNLVSDELEHKFGSNMPPQESPAFGGDSSSTGAADTRSYGGGGGGDYSGGGGGGGGGGSLDGVSPEGGTDIGNSGQSETDHLPKYPTRQVPRPDLEPDGLAGIKETVAAYIGADSNDPYKSIRETPGLGYQVGRYGLSQQAIGDWIGQYLPSDILALLGDPPDWSKLDEVLKKNPDLMKKFQSSMKNAINAEAKKWASEGEQKDSDTLKETAQALADYGSKFDDQQFTESFTSFISNLDGMGNSISNEDMASLLPKEIQEVAATKAAEKMAVDLGIEDMNSIAPQEAATVALGFMLGRTPTPKDLESSADQKFIESASGFYQDALKHLPTEVQVDLSYGNPQDAYKIANGQIDAVKNLLPVELEGRSSSVTERDRYYLFQGDLDNELKGTWFSCGSTSLAMAIIDWSGQSLTPEQKEGIQRIVINDTNSVAEGQFSFGSEGMANFARYYGLSASAGYGLEQAKQDLASGKSIIIDETYNGGGHILYISGVDANGLYIVGDPSFPTTQTWTEAQLANAFPGGGWDNNYTAIWR